MVFVAVFHCFMGTFASVDNNSSYRFNCRSADRANTDTTPFVGNKMKIAFTTFKFLHHEAVSIPCKFILKVGHKNFSFIQEVVMVAAIEKNAPKATTTNPILPKIISCLLTFAVTVASAPFWVSRRLVIPCKSPFISPTSSARSKSRLSLCCFIAFRFYPIFFFGDLVNLFLFQGRRVMVVYLHYELIFSHAL